MLGRIEPSAIPDVGTHGTTGGVGGVVGGIVENVGGCERGDVARATPGCGGELKAFDPGGEAHAAAGVEACWRI